MKFRILHTNDVHSRFENFSRAVTKIRELRDENTIFLDAGDFNDFMRLELQGTGGKAGVELLKRAHCDAIAVGNNETFQSLEVLEYMAGLGLPFLSCNLKKLDGRDIENVRESVIIKRGGVRFLIIGLSPQLGEFFELSGLKTIDYKRAVEKETQKNKGNYDICILLSHIGIREDRDIAETIEEVDIIIDGHTHLLMKEPEYINNKIIHMSGCYGENLGILEFEYDGGIKAFKGENINIMNLDEDRELISSLNDSKEIALDRLGLPLYDIRRDMWHDVIEENPLTNLLADSLKHLLNTEIGIINSGILNGGIKRGAVSRKKILEICPSPLNPTYMEIKGKDIREAVEKSLYGDFCLQDGKGSGFRGRFLGRLHFSGIRVLYKDRWIREIFVNGERLEDERWYSIATSDYLQRGTGYSSLKNNRNVRYSPEYIRDTLMDYLSKDNFLEESYKNRWIEESQEGYYEILR